MHANRALGLGLMMAVLLSEGATRLLPTLVTPGEMLILWMFKLATMAVGIYLVWRR
jgi:hypothetical protein